MLRTPFHDRLAAISETQLWEHWAGYLSAVKYQHSETVEYFAMRDAVGVFDTSPLFKYRFSGRDVVEALNAAQAPGVSLRTSVDRSSGEVRVPRWRWPGATP